MSTSAQLVEQHLADSDRHHRRAQAWSGVLLGLGLAVIVLLLMRGLWPPSSTQLQERDAAGTPAG
jgi:hypothetical protein